MLFCTSGKTLPATILPLLVLLLWPMPARTDHYKVFFAAGQSNMVGTGTRDYLASSAPEYLVPPPNVKYFNTIANGTWTALGPVWGQFAYGPELSFGYALAAAMPGEHLAIIKHAVGGTSLEIEWDPTPEPSEDNYMWRGMMDRSRLALQQLTDAGDTYEFAGMIWMQGENDAGWLAAASAYEDNLRQFITTMRQDVTHQPDLRFIMGQILPYWYGYREEIRQAQYNVGQTMYHVATLATDSFSQYDGIHFDSAGLIDLGNAMAQAYRAMPEPSSGLIALLAGLAVCARRRRRARREQIG